LKKDGAGVTALPAGRKLAAMLRYLVCGRWGVGQVACQRIGSTMRLPADVEAGIERAWQAAKARLGDRLFDGPMCRFERFDVQESRLVLATSVTSYRLFLGTNMAHPDLPDGQRANPIGVSTALVTADGFVMLGRRSDNVAYYPRRLHPFAGSLEPADDLDLFAAARRELHEEVGLTGPDIVELACLGIVEDLRLRHPELILSARTTRTRASVSQSLMGNEHTEAWNCRAEPAAIRLALNATPEAFTPVAVAALTLAAREME
jgi:8-oxo-dGTP pyrophosphatase MutT (NUDIX family)